MQNDRDRSNTERCRLCVDLFPDSCNERSWACPQPASGMDIRDVLQVLPRGCGLPSTGVLVHCFPRSQEESQIRSAATGTSAGTPKGHESVPIWDANAAGRSLAHYTMAPAPNVCHSCGKLATCWEISLLVLSSPKEQVNEVLTCPWAPFNHSTMHACVKMSCTAYRTISQLSAWAS